MLGCVFSFDSHYNPVRQVPYFLEEKTESQRIKETTKITVELGGRTEVPNPAVGLHTALTVNLPS